MRLGYFFVFVILLISGCIHIEKYPDAWDSIQSDTHTNKCPDVSNSYLNEGEKPDGTNVYLALWLAPKSYDLVVAHAVELDLSADQLLTVRATSRHGFYRTWSLEKSKGQFECKKGMLRIPQGGFVSREGVVAFASGSLDLYRTENYLVLNSHGGTAGIALIIPAFGYGSDWARFKIVQQEQPDHKINSTDGEEGPSSYGTVMD